MAGRLNLDWGTLTLDGETRLPYNLSTGFSYFSDTHFYFSFNLSDRLQRGLLYSFVDFCSFLTVSSIQRYMNHATFSDVTKTEV